MNKPRVIIAALKSGSGKTTITCGILAVLKRMGMNPCSFKCGPDYIDPMFHRNVIGIPAGNLDTFFTEDAVTKQLFVDEFDGDIAVIEGVMGLYDGVRGIEEQGSTYDLARAIDAPIVLVVDAKGAGRSVVAELKGFLDYDKHNLICGVILNKTSVDFGKLLGKLIEDELGLAYLGTVPSDERLEVASRHLGLVIPEEIDNLKEKTKLMSDIVSDYIDLNKLIKIANSAQELGIIKTEVNVNAKNIRLAVARDKAFCFYYRENLEALKQAGVELVDFSPILDSHLPDNINGILLGGGYPENYLEELSGNESIKGEIKAAMKKGMPILAECGGFMYLNNTITDPENNTYEMVGAIEGDVSWVGKLVRFGYVTIDDGSLQIKGHEFHYYDSSNNGEGCIARKPSSKRQWQCIHREGGSYMGFPHLYYPSNPLFLENFVEAMKNYG